MNQAFPNPSAILPMYFKINRQARLVFAITQDGTTPNTTGWTWQLFIKEYPGARENIINLTLGNGLRYEIYSETDLIADFSSAQTNIDEREYYWELVRTDIETTWIEGKAFFEFAKTAPDTTTISNYTVNVDSSGSPISITLSTERTINITNTGTTLTLAALGTTLETSASDTPLDADTFHFWDAVDAILKKITWSNIKATLKTYFDTLYPSGSGTSTGTNTGDQTSVSGNAGSATVLQTARNIDGQSFNGSADITVIAPGTHAATGKTTPVDADELPLVDSAASNVLKKLTWANLKATLKTYLDTLYVLLANSATTLTDGATIDLTAIKHTLATSSSRTFTISYTGDDITLEITLSATSATFTLPSGDKGIYNGTPSGTNTLVVTGATSGDVILVAIKKIGTVHYWVGRNAIR